MLTADHDDSSSTSDLGILQDENKVELPDDDDDGLPFWKRIFHLPFEPVWAYFILLLGAFSIYRCIYQACYLNKIESDEGIDELTLIMDLLLLPDVLLLLVGKRIRNLHVPPTKMVLPNWIILCDSLSILPMETFVSHTPGNAKLYYSLKLNDCLKMARIYYVFYHHRNTVGNYKLFLQSCEIIFHTGMVITVGYVITYEIMCRNSGCEIPLNWETYYTFMYVTVSVVTGSGSVQAPYNLFATFFYGILSLLYFFMVACVSMCYVTIELFSKYKNSSIFASKVTLMNEAADKLNVPYDLLGQSQKYYSTLFKRRKGNLDNLKDFVDLPPALCEQIGIDFCLSTFKHSALFRHCDLPFLRYLSYFVESKIMLPGDTVYEHQSVKSELVYVASGVIQILTEEDGMTPILSFSSGTCLGELSLFVSYKSRVKVCCKTHCNLYVLSKKNFMQAVLKVYPKRYRELRQIIFKRISDSRNFRKISQHFNAADQLKNNTDLITIMWLKSTLHRLMIKDGDTLSKHECQNIFLRSEFDKDRFKNKFFIPDYLDTLVIAERVELVTDTVFLKSTCPCVFQADSIVLQTWNFIILVLAILTAFVVPFYAFLSQRSPAMYTAFIYTITIFWWLDLYVRISTAVMTSYEMISNINEIFYYRIGTFGFITDIISAIPFDLFSCVLLFTYSDRYVAFLHLNRILKVYRIERLFKKLEDSTHEIIAISYIKFACYFAYFIYLFTCILYGVKCMTSACPAQADFQDLLWHALVVVQNMTSTSMNSKYSSHDEYFVSYIIIAFCSIVLYILSNAFISAIHVLHRLSKIFLLDTITDIFSIIEYQKLTLKYKHKILNYIETQWIDNKANKLLFNSSAFNDLPSDLYMYMKESVYRSSLLGLPLFSQFPAEVIAEIAVIARSYLLPPNQVLYYRGEVPDDIYIVDRGYCKTIQNRDNQKSKYLGPPEGIAVMEAFLRLPIINTIVTVTHCRSLRINFPELMLLLSKYPNCKQHLENAITETRKVDSILFRDIVTFTNTTMADENETEKSFRSFDYNPKLGSSDQREYDKPFEQLTFLHFVKYFLMRTTILPNGRFLYYWECVRCVCAFFSAVLFTDDEVTMCINCVWFVILIILDIMAWADIYLRFHVAYYNKRNCLVTHPLKTAVYYLTHSFIVDLLAVLPIGSIAVLVFSSYKVKVILHMNRVIQMYRYIAFFRHVDNVNLKYTKLFFVVIEFCPIMIVACVLCGSLFRGVLCEISDNIVSDSPNLTNGIKCVTDSWIHNNFFTKPLSPNQIRWYSIFIATIIFTQGGMPGFAIKNGTIIVLLIIPITIFAYIFSSHIIGKTIAQFTSADSTLLTYQDSLKSIRRFSDDYKVQPDLAHQLIQHFELKWSRQKGKNIHELLKHFHPALKQDILYDIYGEILENISVITTECTAFFRGIILKVNHDVALKNTFVCAINDINTKIYFVLKGQVDVIAADKTLLNSIGPGSMFGTLDDCKMARQTVSILATVHTDVLIIESEVFHSILKQYPNVQQQFKSLTAFHVDFLKGRGHLNIEQEVPDFKNNFNFFKHPIAYMKTAVFNPDGNFIQIWRMFILLIVCTLEVHFTLYQIAMKEYSRGFVIFQYTCDIFHLIHLFISLRTAYENKVGVMIANVGMIHRNFRKNKVKYYLQIISIVPLDIVVWPLPDVWFYVLHPVLRLNRLLRFFYIVFYFREQQEKINCKLYVRYLYTILLTTLLLQFVTCTLIKMSCYHDVPNMQPPLMCNFESNSIFERFKIFLTYYNLISMIYTISYQMRVFPDTAQLTIQLIFVMVILNLIRIVLTAQIYQIVQMTCTQQNKFNLYITRVRHFLKYQRVSLYVINKTCNCLILLWQYHRGTAFPVLLDEAPTLLQELILNSAFSHHIDKHFVFKNCHIDFNRQLVSYLRNSTYFIHDYIVLQGCINQCMYFIHSGVVLVSSIDDTNRETTIATLKGGSSFGVLQGLNKHTPHSYNYRSTTTTVILTLKYSMWKHLLTFFPASQEIINECKINYTDIDFPTVL